MNPLRAVLLDVGGTLWPDAWPPSPDGHYHTRLARALPGLPASGYERLLVDMARRNEAEVLRGTTQDTRALVERTLLEHSLDGGPHVVAAVMEALDLPAEGLVELFPGARELLATIEDLGLMGALVSNTTWRGSHGYRRDLNDLGIDGCVDVVIASLDAGYRKPDERIFGAAVEACGVAPSTCVMVGNSERNDIAPAAALGMRTIRVAIEEPLPRQSRADAVAPSLYEVEDVLRGWCRAEA
ncbi:MAG: HAD family hydrolase [Actinomycetota bacterium]